MFAVEGVWECEPAKKREVFRRHTRAVPGLIKWAKVSYFFEITFVCLCNEKLEKSEKFRLILKQKNYCYFFDFFFEKTNFNLIGCKNFAQFSMEHWTFLMNSRNLETFQNRNFFLKIFPILLRSWKNEHTFFERCWSRLTIFKVWKIYVKSSGTEKTTINFEKCEIYKFFLKQIFFLAIVKPISFFNSERIVEKKILW